MPRRFLTGLAMVVLLAGACSDDDGGGDDDPVLGEPTPTPTTAADATTTPAPEDQVTEITISVEGGEVTGAEGRLAVDAGSPVVIRVEADTSDHVHIHGYDLMADVAPGQPAVIEFVADLEGVWEVELEDAGLHLFDLEVS